MTIIYYKWLFFVGIVSISACANNAHSPNVENNLSEISDSTSVIAKNNISNPVAIKYGREWEGFWMNEKGEKYAENLEGLHYYFRGIKLNIEAAAIGHNLPEVVTYPIDTSTYYSEGYLVKDAPPYYLSDYFLDYIDSDRFSNILKNLLLNKIPKGYKLYLRMEISEGLKYLVFTIKTKSNTKTEHFIPYYSANEFIVGNYADQTGEKAVFSTKNNCNWLNYQSYELALAENRTILYLSKMPRDSVSSERYMDKDLMDVFILNCIPNQRLYLYKIAGLDKSSTQNPEIVYVSGYPEAIVNPIQGSLQYDLKNNE